jgi:chromosomal replication initiator protein
LRFPNELTRGMLEQRVRLPLLAALESIEDSDISSFRDRRQSLKLKVTFSKFLLMTSHRAGLPSRESPTPQNLCLVGQDQSRLNNKYSFDNFVIGSSNRFSHAAAVAVAEAPAKAYNPSVRLWRLRSRENPPTSRHWSLCPESLQGHTGEVCLIRRIHQRLY